MDFSFPVQDVTEGAARLLVPDVPRRKGPGTVGPWPFYNPTMAVNRDMSAMVITQWPLRLGSVLDGLAATGAWGIRMALEARLPGITFNDRSLAASALIGENVRRNGIDASVRTNDLVDLLQSTDYDFVDIDPFGTPTPFLDSAFACAPTPSGLGITATDTAVLCGTYPEACLRRYASRPLRCHQGGEIGLRILLAHCERLAEGFGKSIRPILSFAAEHFLRILLVVEKRTDSAADRLVTRQDAGQFHPAETEVRGTIGPLWMESMHDSRIVAAMTASEWTSVQSARLLATLQAEADLPPFFVTTDELAARERGSPPKVERFIEALHEMGYRAARTHFHPRGVKTDASYQDTLRAFRDRMPTGSTGGSAPAS